MLLVLVFQRINELTAHIGPKWNLVHQNYFFYMCIYKKKLLLPHFNLCQYRLWLDLKREEIGLTKARFDMERKEKGRVYSRGRTRME